MGTGTPQVPASDIIHLPLRQLVFELEQQARSNLTFSRRPQLLRCFSFLLFCTRCLQKRSTAWRMKVAYFILICSGPYWRAIRYLIFLYSSTHAKVYCRPGGNEREVPRRPPGMDVTRICGSCLNTGSIKGEFGLVTSRSDTATTQCLATGSAENRG